MKTILNVKTDKDVKAKAQHVAKQLGLPLSTIINAFLKEFIRTKAILFSLNPKHKTIDHYLRSLRR